MADNKIPSGKIEVSDRIMKQMLKPIVFGNHQKQFKVFTFLVCSCMTLYMIFKHDFGDRRHCFTSIREYAERRKQQFFAINEQDIIKLKEHKKN